MNQLGLNLFIILISSSKLLCSTSSSNDCPFEGCHCVTNPMGDDISIDCISTSLKSEFPKRRLATTNETAETPHNISLLIFYGYDIDAIPDYSFANLTIKYLHFVSTRLRSIKTNTFAGVHYLEEFVVYGAELDTVEKDALAPVKSTLRKLDLSNCKLDTKKMDRFTPQFKVLTWLKYLYLAENNFRELKNRWFSSFEMVKEINLAKNGIQFVPGDVFKSNKFLRVIDLSTNRIEKFPRVFTRPNFSYRFSLQVVKLNQNQLRVVEAFSDLEELLDLDLSENLVEEIEFKTFRKLINLERLRLNNNNIRFIEKDSFSTLTRLRGLFLNNNYLNAIPSLANLNELITLNIENQNGKLTSLDDFSFDTKSPQRYANLVVYMRSNPITNWSDRVFCSQNKSATTSFDVIYIDYQAIENMDRCALKQLSRAATKHNGYPVYLIIDDENISQSTDIEKDYKNVCNCEFLEFARRNEINVIGICRFLHLKCEETSEKSSKTIEIDCASKPEYKCHV